MCANITNNKVKVMLTLHKIGNPMSANDVYCETGVEKSDAQKFLHQLEEEGIVSKVPPLSASMSNIRFYKLTTTAKQQIQELLATKLEELIGPPKQYR